MRVVRRGFDSAGLVAVVVVAAAEVVGVPFFQGDVVVVDDDDVVRHDARLRGDLPPCRNGGSLVVVGKACNTIKRMSPKSSNCRKICRNSSLLIPASSKLSLTWRGPKVQYTSSWFRCFSKMPCIRFASMVCVPCHRAICANSCLRTKAML